MYVFYMHHYPEPNMAHLDPDNHAQTISPGKSRSVTYPLESEVGAGGVKNVPT
jgi:hypothetical protein